MLWLGFQCSDHIGGTNSKAQFKATLEYDSIFARRDNRPAQTNSGLQTRFRCVLFFFLRA